MKVVISTTNWDEMLKALNTRNVGFYKATKEGFLYAPITNGGLIDTNPSVVAEYITK